ncbi:MAG: cadherin-like beta sandwich domain-containing protein [Parabacteroides sp.]|nr:cadherin-like beta sandwich domain-containing protein [Parabacteroides sp.]
MKKHLIAVFGAFILLFFTLSFLPAWAAGTVNVSLSANPSTARPGDVVTVSVNLKGVSGAGGVAAGGVTITYDTSRLTYQSATIGGGKPAADLDISASGSTVKLLYLDNTGGSNGFSSDTVMATVKFKVNNVSPGSAAFTVTAEGFGDKRAASITANASGTTLSIAEPLSGNADLASLAVSNATISPTFSKGTTSYTASVPYGVSKLDVQAAAEDSGAKANVNSPNLTPGGTTNVTVTVTAANGSKKTYTIKVTREKDPNYKASSNNTLSSITVDGFLLSPGFKGDVTSYVIWLPYETSSVKFSGKAADDKASVEVVGGENLAAGQDNPVKIICIAEDGSKKEYNVIAKRAAAHDGSVDEVTSESPGESKVTSSGVVAETDTKPSGGTPVWLTLLLMVVAAGAGFGGGFVVKSRKDE